MASYLYAVQDENGREIVSAHVDVEEVEDVTATRDGATVRLMFEDVEVESGTYDGDGPVTLYVWPSTFKTAEPKRYPVQ